MMLALIALMAGLLFGFGLLYSGMANPAVVQGFLDIFGEWNPSLMWVMVGALLVTAMAYLWLYRRGKTLLNSSDHLPKNSAINTQLMVGGALFGAGWGIVGICPAPALLLVGMGIWEGALFFIAMLIGMLFIRWLMRVRY